MDILTIVNSFLILNKNAHMVKLCGATKDLYTRPRPPFEDVFLNVMPDA